MTDPALRPLLDDPPLWRLLLDPRGRLGRGAWWRWAVGLQLLLGVLLGALVGIAGVQDTPPAALAQAALAWPFVAVSAKRWHDIGRSAWWVLVGLVPLLGWAVLLVANGLLRGAPGANRYGPPEADRDRDMPPGPA